MKRYWDFTQLKAIIQNPTWSTAEYFATIINCRASFQTFESVKSPCRLNHSVLETKFSHSKIPPQIDQYC